MTAALCMVTLHLVLVEEALNRISSPYTRLRPTARCDVGDATGCPRWCPLDAGRLQRGEEFTLLVAVAFDRGGRWKTCRFFFFLLFIPFLISMPVTNAPGRWRSQSSIFSGNVDWIHQIHQIRWWSIDQSGRQMPNNWEDNDLIKSIYMIYDVWLNNNIKWKVIIATGWRVRYCGEITATFCLSTGKLLQIMTLSLVNWWMAISDNTHRLQRIHQRHNKQKKNLKNVIC